MITIKEFILWLLNERYDLDVTEEEVDEIMFSYGFKHNQEIDM